MICRMFWEDVYHCLWEKTVQKWETEDDLLEGSWSSLQIL